MAARLSLGVKLAGHVGLVAAITMIAVPLLAGERGDDLETWRGLLVAVAVAATAAFAVAVGILAARIAAPRARRAADLEARITDLTAERDRLSAVLAGMTDGVLVIDASERVLLANPAAAHILGRAPAPGAHVRDALRDAAALDVIAAAARSNAAREAEIETPPGGGRSIALSARPLATDARRGLVIVLRDMTHIHRLLAIRRDFVANVSHELRTPVTAIQGYAETLARGPALDGDTSRLFLDIIHRQSQRIGQLVTGLLRLSEIEAQSEGEQVRERFVLRPLAEAVEGAMRASAEERGVRVTIAIPEKLAVMGDPIGVEQVLLNLVDNAIKYGRRGGEVTIRASRRRPEEAEAAEEALIEIADDGPGIAAHHLPRLFERFYRVDAGRSREHGGSGLGLAIVKHLVEAMGGTIDVASTVDEGTTFSFRLPSPPNHRSNARSLET